MKQLGLYFSEKDIKYIREQDFIAYEIGIPRVLVRFVNEDLTIIDKFNTQTQIGYYDPVLMPVLIKLDSMRKVQDAYNLSEVPEATAVFSQEVLDRYAKNYPDIPFKVQADVLVEAFNVMWRISSPFPQDFIGMSNTTLHWECTLTRSMKTSTINDGANPSKQVTDITGTFLVGQFDHRPSIDEAIRVDSYETPLQMNLNNEYLSIISDESYTPQILINGREFTDLTLEKGYSVYDDQRRYDLRVSSKPLTGKFKLELN